MSSFVSNLCVFVTLLFNCGIQFEASRGRYRGGPVRQGHCPVGNRSRRILLLPPRDAGLLPPHRSAAFRPCHYPHLFRTHISTSTWYSKTPRKPRELGLPPSTDGVHALSAKSCATARRSRAADHRFVKRSGIMTYIISLTQQTLQKMWVMTRPLGCRSAGSRCGAGKSQRPPHVLRCCSLKAALLGRGGSIEACSLLATLIDAH